MLMRALAALLLLAGAAHADALPFGFTASLTNASAPTTGATVNLGGPKSSVVMLLSYTGTGGEIIVEAALEDGLIFVPVATLPLDSQSNPQVRVYFDRGRHQSPDVNRPATSRDPLVPGQPASFVRARLASVSGASGITATFGE